VRKPAGSGAGSRLTGQHRLRGPPGAAQLIARPGDALDSASFQPGQGGHVTFARHDQAGRQRQQVPASSHCPRPAGPDPVPEEDQVRQGTEEELRGAEQLVHRAAAGPDLTRDEPDDEDLGEVLGGEPVQMTPELAG